MEDALARALEAEAACLWHDWTGALVVAAAACVAGEGLQAIAALPDPGGRPSRVVLQRGHVIGIGGGSLLQLLRLGGAAPVEIGAVDACGPEELAGALGAGAVAGLHVACGPRPGLIGLAPFVWACREAAVPALVLLRDAGSPAAALDAGAALVVLDGAALGGPACGVVAGEAALVRACRLQGGGVGRAFKPLPAQVDGLARALADRAG